MEYRILGSTGLKCSVLSLGTSRLTSIGTKVSRKDAVALIHTAADLGINFIDTADIYGQGDSESVVGEAIQGRRTQFIVATKIGYRFSRSTRLVSKAKPFIRPIVHSIRQVRKLVAIVRDNARATQILEQDFSPTYLVRALEHSLKRLRTEYLDILYLHDVPLEVAQSAEVSETLESFRNTGKVRHFGLSIRDDEVLQYARKQSIFGIVQTAVNPERPDELWPTLSTLRTCGIGIVGNKVFDSGRLLNSDCKDVGKSYGMDARRALMTFAVLQPSVCSVLTGTTNASHLKENATNIISAMQLSPSEPLP